VSRYLVRRLAWGVALLLAITFCTYAVFSIIPYDPGRILYPAGSPLTAAQLRTADHKLGVDKPFYDQYWSFLKRVAEHGSLGQTFTGIPLGKLIADTAPVTALLVLGGALAMLVLAIPLGLLSARYPNTRIDRLVLAVSVLGIALHPFVVGVVLKHVFGNTLHALPTGGYCPMHHLTPPKTIYTYGGQLTPVNSLPHQELVQFGYYNIPAVYCAGAAWPWRWVEHMILPWITFALFFLPFYVRIIRTRLIESYHEPFVLTARAKGASELRVLVRHLLRPISATIVTMFAFDVGVGITAAMYVETVYGLPGLANQALVALGTKEVPGYDLPMMTGIVIVVAATIVVLNIVADLVSARLDPRIRLS
jgi:peptide/nickel transport system permease protein